ncbi:response regulator transcription factor [Spirosoma sp. BT702]|uniref:Response regulator transcription factor n=1 Tax=Spirosoma profusum TaxID=2771354 RepID=A0A926Y229_9BACT|nr:LytTR family DNA-binding domain-containing protein [Spirosoma profusum]MBD2702722.1 response regulator transcription factor [Spirosoma profusum]
MLRTIIIDDEPDNVELLAMQLARHCPQIELVGQFTESPKALLALRSLQPALVFLDIEMPMLNGFQLLEQLGEVTFQVIFVTAYNQYAVQAFRFAALDYLLKPVDTVDLVQSVGRAEQVVQRSTSAWPIPAHILTEQLELLRTYYPSTGGSEVPRSGTPSRLALPHANGIAFVDTSQILYAESDSNYTHFVLNTGEKYLVSKTLGDVQELLESRNFLRVHRQYIVNLNHIKRLVKGEGTYLVLSDGSNIPVSRQQKDRLLERFGWV